MGSYSHSKQTKIKSLQFEGFLARVNIVINSSCTYGNVLQGIDHIVWQCPLLDEKIIKLLSGWSKLKMQLPMEISTLLIDSSTAACKLICAFLNICNLRV